ncbi:MAG: 1-phosphofructokinase family hexose kinase [Promethearchaeota archaeon]
MAIVTLTLNPTVDHVLEVRDFEVGGTFRVGGVYDFPLGKGLSVALALKTLGRDPVAVSLVGVGEVEAYEEFLSSRGIRHHLVPVGGKTRRNTTIVDLGPGQPSVTHLREPGFRACSEHLETARERIRELVVPGDWVVLSGSLPPGLPSSTYGDLIRELRSELGVNCALDTSGRALMEGASAGPTLLKPNWGELGELLGEELGDIPVSMDEFADYLVPLVAGGVSIVCLTLGGSGAVVMSRRELAWVGASVGKPINTVGCGDSFLAGFVATWTRTRDLVEAAKMGAAAGAANTLISGAGMFERGDLEGIFKSVGVLGYRVHHYFSPD